MLTSIIPAAGWWALMVNPHAPTPTREPLVGFGLTSEGRVVGLVTGEGGAVLPVTENAQCLGLWHPQQGLPHEVKPAKNGPKPSFRGWHIQD
jgi:hypothetical protein